jgi:hypothetical protein
MAIPRSEEIKDLAIKYSKQQLAQLAQRGEVDPTTAIMAGMMRDRIVQSEMIQQMPDTTVFQDTFTPKQDMASAVSGPPQDQLAQMRAPVEGQPQMAAGLSATPQAAMVPQMGQSQAPVMAAEGGLMALDVPDDMVPDEYAGGGIIAFANGGMPVDYAQFGTFGRRLEDEAKLREQFLGKDQSVADLMGYIQGLEGKSGERADRMFNLRLAQAGLGIAGGQSPYALQNVATGAAPALEGYAGDIAKQEETEMARKKVLAELGGRERAEKIGVFEGARKAEESAADRASRERVAAMPGETERIAAQIRKEAAANGEKISAEDAARRAKAALTAPPDRYNALSNRLTAANKDFATRSSILQQQLSTAKTEKERTDIQKKLEDLRTAVQTEYSISPADLAELQAAGRVAAPKATGLTVTAPDGRTYTFPTQQAADEFRRKIQGQ